MSAADRSDRVPAASDVAGRLRDAAFVRFVATPDGDALAATGVLARAHDGPFQASVARGPIVAADATDVADADGADDAADADLTLHVGLPGGDLALTERPLSATAIGVADDLGLTDTGSADAVRLLALAGAVAAGAVPGEHDLLDGSEVAVELERAAGVARPTSDDADAFAHTTLAHATFSADPEAARQAVEGLDHPRKVASAYALSCLEGAPDRAADAVQRALRPHELPSTDGDETATAQFATLEGYADVLDACAQQAPGIGVALALGHDVRDAALDAWRDHGVAVHRAVHDAELSRHRGLVVATVPESEDAAATEPDDVHDGLAAVAQLVRDFRSPEPVAVAVAADQVAVAAAERSIAEPVAEAADAVGGTAFAGGWTDSTDDGRHARATVPTAERDAFVEALRRAVT